MSSFLQDVRIAVRGYLAKPLFTIVVLSILGLAIGANSAIFSVVNAVLLRPLEYPRASELVSVAERDRTTQRRRSISPPNYFDLKEQARSFAGVAAYWSPSINLSGDGGDPGESAGGHLLVRSLQRARRAAPDRPGAHEGRRRPWREAGGGARPWTVEAALRRRPERRRPGDEARRHADADRRRHAAGVRLSRSRDGALGAAAPLADAAAESRRSRRSGIASTGSSTSSPG